MKIQELLQKFFRMYLHKCNWTTRRKINRKQNRSIIQSKMAENFLNLMTGSKPQIQKVAKTPSRMNNKIQNKQKPHLNMLNSNHRKSKTKRKS